MHAHFFLFFWGTHRYPKWPNVTQNFKKLALSSLQCHKIDNCISKNPAYIHTIKKHSYKYLFKKSRYPKWAPFGEIFAKKCQFLYIMYVKAWKRVSGSHWIENNAGEKHLMFRVPRIGWKLPKMAQNSPKFKKNGHFSVLMPWNR